MMIEKFDGNYFGLWKMHIEDWYIRKIFINHSRRHKSNSMNTKLFRRWSCARATSMIVRLDKETSFFRRVCWQ